MAHSIPINAFIYTNATLYSVSNLGKGLSMPFLSVGMYALIINGKNKFSIDLYLYFH